MTALPLPVQSHDEDLRISLTPGQLAWRQLRKNRFALFSGVILIVLYLMAIFGEFLAPYPYDVQRPDLFLHPPTHLVFHDPSGRFSLRPYVYASTATSSIDYVDVPGSLTPVRFFARGYPYKLLLLFRTNIHLFETDNRAPLFLLGSDDLGRDVFSRLLMGGQISLTVGLVAICITFTLGLLIGGVSGYYGGQIDNVLMRLSEVFMSIPTFYLLIALAAVMPPKLSPQRTFLFIIVILSFVGWASLARVIRGIALSAREREYVEAARALGVSSFNIIRRHVLPNSFTFAIVSATLSIPSYIIAEASLSFLGLGIREPMPSWGNMLSAAQQLDVLTKHLWILSPGVMIFVTVMAYNFLGDGLRDALDPRLRR